LKTNPVLPFFRQQAAAGKAQPIVGCLALLPDYVALFWPILALSCVSLSRYADVGECLGGTGHKELGDSQPNHRPSGCAAEYDGLEDHPFPRTIGNASHLAPGLHGRAGDTLQDQASIVDALYGSVSKGYLRFFKELLLLWPRKTNDESGEAR
jgi:hypothetical protein